MLLYVHVPFCRSKCSYCSFYSIPGKPDSGLAGSYLTGLVAELVVWGRRLGSVPVETVFFGGGTPSLLPARVLGSILDWTAKVFSLAQDAEITAEANPESALADNWLYDARKAGVNRLSMGVQSFDDAALALLGRPHTAREAYAAYDTARRAGFSSISLDLMWGLPDQSRGRQQMDWLRDLRAAADLQPEHLSTYCLTLEQESPLWKQVNDNSLVLPSEREQSMMFMSGAEYLESQGIMQYEISNFARLGYECRHNLGYWQGEKYLGCGPSAVSTLGARRWTNYRNLQDWQKAVNEERCGTARGGELEELSTIERHKEMLMLSLRMSKGISLSRWQERTGRNFMQDFYGLIQLLIKNGLAAKRRDAFRLTRSGLLVSNSIIERFFQEMDGPDFQRL